MRVAIIGGGIAGLAAAFELQKAGQDYVIYEKRPRLGGSIYSERVRGCIVEGGPDSFLTEKPAAARLCKELGIGDSIVGSNDESRKTYIVVKNKLVAMPDGLMFMVPTKLLPTAATRLFSVKTKVRMAMELLLPPRPMDHDESVAEMVLRHFGSEVVDRLADPLLAGIYGGDCAQLSAKTVLPRMVEMEEEFGSLSRGMLAAHAKMKTAGAPTGPKRSMFSTLKGGMRELVDEIQLRLRPGSVRTSTIVDSITRNHEGWNVIAEGKVEYFHALIMAAPAWAAGRLLREVDAPLASDLEAIPYSSSITVTVGFEEADVPKLPEGFGFLVPASEKRSMMACTFVHRKFPGRAPAGLAMLRCFLGGARNEGLLHAGDAQIEAVVREELRQILGIEAVPLFVRIHRNKSAMAQYTVGHQARAERIAQAVSELPNLALAGNAYQGIGVPDCIRSGQQAAARVLSDFERFGESVELTSKA